MSDAPAVRPMEDRLAPVMFALAFADLLLVAGLIHRATTPSVRPIELDVMHAGLAALWPVFAVESLLGYVRRSAAVSRRTALLRVLLVWLLPPARLGWVHPATGRIWLPRLGWHPPGKPLLKTLDKLFGGPMLVFAFLILPVLGAEYLLPDQSRAVPGFSLALDIGVSAIWVAFAFEFIVKSSAAPSTLGYAKERWLDLSIVLLPTLEFVLTRWVDAAPLARLLRLGRAVAPEQLAKLGKAYRLRGLLMKGWHAFLLLEGMARLTGHGPQKRLLAISDRIAELEEEIADLRSEEAELRKVVAAPVVSPPVR